MTPMLIRPFRGLRPAPGRASDVAAPPYDVLDADEARELGRSKKWSFLHVSRPEIDFPVDADPYAPAVYSAAAQNLTRLVETGVLCRDRAPCYYAYRLTAEGHVQTGLALTARIPTAEQDRIRRHEETRPDRESDRVRQMEASNGQTSPILLAYPQLPVTAEILGRATTARPPDTEAVVADAKHSLWVVDDRESVEQLTREFETLDAFYVADGHHRLAAASRVAAARRAGPGTASGIRARDYVLAVVFPDDQLRILGYHRVVRDLNGHSPDEFLELAAQEFTIEPVNPLTLPARAGEFSMYMCGKWYRLTSQMPESTSDDLTARLDVGVLADRILAPLLASTTLASIRALTSSVAPVVSLSCNAASMRARWPLDSSFIPLE